MVECGVVDSRVSAVVSVGVESVTVVCALLNEVLGGAAVVWWVAEWGECSVVCRRSRTSSDSCPAARFARVGVPTGWAKVQSSLESSRACVRARGVSCDESCSACGVCGVSCDESCSACEVLDVRADLRAGVIGDPPRSSDRSSSRLRLSAGAALVFVAVFGRLSAIGDRT